jgi:hypothetical protein
MKTAWSFALATAILIATGAVGAGAQEKSGTRPWLEQRRFERLCAGGGQKSDDSIPDRLGQYLLLNDDQKAALKEVHEAFLKALNGEKSLCSSKPDFQTVPGRMAFDQAKMEARLDGVKQVRAKMDGFYSSLNDEQKAKFNRGYNQNQERWRHPYDDE